ncbi:hypothetical protein COC42_00240 [Sphingomonas spermidinifaciens]|uniref:Uncharacterized protein n=1 Tax=Sphingomonas spermidinifaciens TaxID=1141889 RepID=A0A2A4B5I4_9SPHN|nr:glycosyltransferase family 39 protein [Sphingomonas spermidinifaciens]PCD02914.1 hypothetical protein COC42_00240 [Sphingomonas spermidinifaciens]
MPFPRSTLIAIVAATAGALAVRMAAARGGLWLDEAWSAVFARDAATAISALRIGHDNNHVLNTWWLQLVGWPASPIAMRGLSILSGTAAVPLAALIAGRKGPLAAALAAWLFALSPALVTYGSEARGYAPMLLALLAAILMIGQSLDAPDKPPPVVGIAIALALGTLAQLTMLFALPALIGWVLWAGRSRQPLRTTARLLGPGLIAASLSATAVLAGGMTIGSYQPFTIAAWADGLGELARYTLAIGWPPKGWLLALTAAGSFALVVARAEDHRAALTALAVLAFPVAVAALGIGNSGLPRYYLIAAAVLLLAIAEAPRTVALPLSIVILGGSVIGDLDLVRNLRADPREAVTAMANARPQGATYAVEASRDAAVIEVAAAQARYPIRLVEAPCPAADFLFVARDGDAPFPDSPARCGIVYAPFAGARTTGLSGNHWQLYLRAR